MQINRWIGISGIAAFILAPALVDGQDFKGQWKGEFEDRSTGSTNWGSEKCEYVLELETVKNSITGFSYTYFTQNGKKYYTICKVDGKFDKKQKFLQITETQRVKTNIPDEIKNCFQVHKLTYFKKGNEESLEGDWIPAPNQQGDCGFGQTSLSRRMLDNSFINRNSNKVNNKQNNKSAIASAPVKKNTDNKPPAENKKITNTNDNSSSNPKESASAAGSMSEINKTTQEIPVVESSKKYEKRANSLIKTIEVIQPKIKVELYDNGEIDGDSISIFLNGKLLVSRRRLTEKAITLNIDLDSEQEEFELEMYAENLGTIPPNTAVMVVTDGNKRYETRITSDLKKSGVVRLIRKKAS
jgi:hypothetical protein